MSSSKSNGATLNFRPEYPVHTTKHGQAQYQRDQSAYAQVPQDVRQDIIRLAERVDNRRQQWEKANEERERALDETETARRERRNRFDPDIRYLRNKKNREQHALAKLDYAQRDYMKALERAGGHVDTLNTTQRNRIPETSNYTTPFEIQSYIGSHADYRPVSLPSVREYWQLAV